MIINGTEEDVKRQTEEMLERRLLAKQTKASKVSPDNTTVVYHIYKCYAFKRMLF